VVVRAGETAVEIQSSLTGAYPTLQCVLVRLPRSATRSGR
jgi:hypothetical protein